MFFSLIIPVYNRPEEIDELLQSLLKQKYENTFEVVIVEDGSAIDCKGIVEKYKNQLFLSYYFKPNSGPGDSRNFGMNKAKGDYFIILDSDCIIPENYLFNAEKNLEQEFVDCFGGPDAALQSFSTVQKAINFAMTSVLTTGGVRGNSEKVIKFQPRSFNMGLSKAAFMATGGFGNIHPGEDPDLSIRLWKLGYKTKLFKDTYVYHKRRIDWYKFYVQVNKFGKARPILDKWHPEYAKLTFAFPSVFIIVLCVALLLVFFGITFPILFFLIYFLLTAVFSGIKNNSLIIGIYSVLAVFIQFYGYGTGYLKSFIQIVLFKKKPEEAFPELFFKK